MSGYRYMTLADRRNIETWLSEKVPPTVIADRLGVHLSTVYREIGRGRTADAAYSAARAQETVEISLRRITNEETARYYFMRSPNPSSAGNVRYVNTSGALSNGSAYGGNGAAAACVIRKSE